jgi:hypothetical protein
MLVENVKLVDIFQNVVDILGNVVDIFKFPLIYCKKWSIYLYFRQYIKEMLLIGC